jgi:hypothetical protein
MAVCSFISSCFSVSPAPSQLQRAVRSKGLCGQSSPFSAFSPWELGCVSFERGRVGVYANVRACVCVCTCLMLRACVCCVCEHMCTVYVCACVRIMCACVRNVCARVSFALSVSPLRFPWAHWRLVFSGCFVMLPGPLSGVSLVQRPSQINTPPWEQCGGGPVEFS